MLKSYQYSSLCTIESLVSIGLRLVRLCVLEVKYTVLYIILWRFIIFLLITGNLCSVIYVLSTYMLCQVALRCFVLRNSVPSLTVLFYASDNKKLELELARLILDNPNVFSNCCLTRNWPSGTYKVYKMSV